jgi:N-acetylmuramoyl-L-alanine amidase
MCWTRRLAVDTVPYMNGDRVQSGIVTSPLSGATSRRAFLKCFAIVGLAISAQQQAQAKGRAKASPSVRFTKLVRAKTKTLSVESGRWQYIVGHHSGIKNGNAAIYDRAHRERGMENGLAYHFVIGNGIDSGDGEIEIGPRWLKQLKGGHVHREEINEVGIGICLVGNFEETKPTAKQLAAFRELVDYLRSDVVGKKVRFAVHKEIDPGRTVCPGRYFPIAEMHRLYGPFEPINVARGKSGVEG